MSGDGGARGAALAIAAAVLGLSASRGVARAAVAHVSRSSGRRAHLATAAVLAAGALAAFVVKAFYARAGADELQFVLAPTAALVERISGVAFEREAGAGYLSRERSYLIAPACAGLNFAIAAFAMLVLGFAPRLARGRAKAGWLLAAATLACAATLLVNATRISIDLALRESTLPAWLPHAQAHRLEGIALYLASLWTLYAAVDAGFARRAPRWRAALVPLGSYLAVALLVPALNGAYARPEFWKHASEVLALSLALTAALAATTRSVRRGRLDRLAAGPLCRRVIRASPPRASRPSPPECTSPCSDSGRSPPARSTASDRSPRRCSPRARRTGSRA